MPMHRRVRSRRGNFCKSFETSSQTKCGGVQEESKRPAKKLRLWVRKAAQLSQL